MGADELPTSEDGRPDEAAHMLCVLELLAAEAPPAQVRDLVRDFGRRDPRPDREAVLRLERAESLALQVHSLFARRQQREAELSALVDTARDLTLPYELDTLMETVTRRTRGLLGMDMSYISFHDDGGNGSFVQSADGHASALTVGYRVPDESGLGRAATEKGVPIWTPDYLSDDSFRHTGVLDEVVRAEGIRAIIAAPLSVGGNTFGVLYAADRNVRHFSVNDVALMSSLGGLAAVAIDKTRALERSHADVAGLSDVRRLGETHSRLVDLALAGGGLQTLATEVAEVLGGSVLVRDMEHRSLAAVGTMPTIDEDEARAAVQTAAALGPQRANGGGAGVWAAPVMAGSEELAVLLLHPRRPLNDAGTHRMRLAAQAVAVLLQVQRSEATAASPFRDELFDDLLALERRPLKQLELRASRLGIAHEQSFAVVVVRPEGGTAGRAASWAASYAHRVGGLRSIQSGCVSLLLPMSAAPDPDWGAGEFARSVSEQLDGLLGQPATVGAGGPVRGLGRVRKAHQEAMRCMEALVALGNVGASASAADLGFLGVLLSDDRDVAAFVDATIGPVLDYDAQRLTDLTRTLDAFFAASGSPTNAAELLHVHPNTVSRRLERVAELLGADWSKPAKALDVQLALRLHRTNHVLRHQRRTGRTAEPSAQADRPHTTGPSPYTD
ncbi:MULTISPECIES: helix-turn-helix domain-containing protein [Streptomyces]|uniref:Helix-turn-helix domain-containing protein n=1 Tax=Streptomyces caniscabiei TaxID=2746961 RepID=A0ABU4MY25_9ACTN|nr:MULTISPECIES: helix-turn-helix domain-containing protein [Streptomyces]MDX2946203.1 helix-turn-helix domain-containing protein [Streptomyces caniscabiei]MDX2956367.1 helix-turn-helix domain-containing protein [Streptomyces caniscabiei]MDX2989576.1 helix-turn-helix domain-containing protein [Streptomyces caniscabiei]MDX3014417.1 helix-turn-helix domain-containing protein [Streptomyces caniscabiei]MDX3041657.1 helix-turn-helix domain-containing protein [Streptomyces caniscabiei]